MNVVAAFAVIAMILVNYFGSKASVGGPMTEFLVSFVIMLAVGLTFAWTKGFGPLGWLTAVVVAIIGGIAGIVLLGAAMEAILDVVHFQGRLVNSNWVYLVSTVMALAAVIASWLPLEIGNRLMMRRHES